MSHRSSISFIPSNMSELRVVLLGNSWSERSSVGNFLLGENKFNTAEEADCCVRVSGLIHSKEIVLINTPDLLHPSISEDKLRGQMETCVRLSDPGPHMFLLVIQPEDFTEEHKLRLCELLNIFSDYSFDHSLVLTSTPRADVILPESYMRSQPLQDLIARCRFQSERQKFLEVQELQTKMELTVDHNDGRHLICHPSRAGAPVHFDCAQSIVKSIRIF